MTIDRMTQCQQKHEQMLQRFKTDCTVAGGLFGRHSIKLVSQSEVNLIDQNKKIVFCFLAVQQDHFQANARDATTARATAKTELTVADDELALVYLRASFFQTPTSTSRS
jgi:hypothetical protein